MRDSARTDSFPGDEWTLWYRGVLLGGDSPLVPLEISGIGDMPEIKDYDLELVGTHGRWPGRDWMRGRTIHLRFRVIAKDARRLADLMGEVNAAFTYGGDGGEEELHFCIPGIAQGVRAKVRGRVRKRSLTIDSKYAASLSPIIDVQLDCTDPWIRATGTYRRDMTAGSWDKGGIDLTFPGAPLFDFTRSTEVEIPNTAKMRDQAPAVVANGSMSTADMSVRISGPAHGGVWVEFRKPPAGLAASELAETQAAPSGDLVGKIGITKYGRIPLELSPTDVFEFDTKSKRAFITQQGRRTDVTPDLQFRQWCRLDPGSTVLCYLMSGRSGSSPAQRSFAFAPSPHLRGEVSWTLDKFI
ncbi:hypothetical protein ABZ714_13240 [Streptomyces sp. NPDC006798]|uniref:hypothetical protein n=1 Tax=Streptomyces sp. NPDC006798 TaxID=3155462 RepID=UPI0033C992C8